MSFETPIQSDALHFVLAREIYYTLVHYKGNMGKAASQLKIPSRTFYRKVRKYGIRIDLLSREVTWPREARLKIV